MIPPAAGRHSIGSFRTKADADAALTRAGAAQQAGTFVAPSSGRVRFDVWSEQWLATIANLRPSARERDAQYLTSLILPTFGGRELGQIEHMQVRGWVAQLSATGKAPATVVKAHQILSKVMRSAVEAQLVGPQPV